MPTSDRRFRCLAVNDSASTCSCCGRKGLKRVAWLLDTSTLDEPLPYGTTCAAHLLLEREPSEAKPKLSVAERVLAEALVAEQNRIATEILAEVLPLEVPPVTEGRNRFGVQVAVCGDAAEPFIVGASLERMAPRAVQAWHCKRAREIADARGFAPRCGTRAAFDAVYPA